MVTKYSKKTINAIKKYEEDKCVWCYEQNMLGDGAASLSWSLKGRYEGRYGSAVAAINAGEELCKINNWNSYDDYKKHCKKEG